jgi:hypothetical protein
MDDAAQAAAHLRTIRDLMERATVYRAVSAPAALAGGAVAVGLSAWQMAERVTAREFVAQWLLALVGLTLLNFFLLAREARRAGRPAVSAGARLALRGVVPPLAVGGVVGLGLAVQLNETGLAAAVWTACYGLALLATGNFAPASIRWLGRAFVGLGLLTFVCNLLGWPISWFTAGRIMAVGFGALHLLYGLAVLSRRPVPAA